MARRTHNVIVHRCRNKLQHTRAGFQIADFGERDRSFR